MFHRNARPAAHRRARAPRVIVPIEPVVPLGAGFMRQRPFAEVVLGAPPYRIGDVVRVTARCRYSAHVGRRGSVVGIGGTHKLILVELDGGGVVYFETHELRLVRSAPTAVLPVVRDEPVGVTVVQVSGGAIGYWSPGWNAMLDALADTAVMDAVDELEAELDGAIEAADQLVDELAQEVAAETLVLDELPLMGGAR